MLDEKEIESIKKDIFNNVKIYYEKYFKKKEKFIPGETRINYAGRVFDENEIINLVDSSLDFWLTEGRFTSQFQEELSSFIGVKYCLLTTSGSSANLLAISALTSNKLGNDKRLKPGDEIITVAAGFPTTIFPIIQNQAIPVFLDIECPDLAEYQTLHAFANVTTIQIYDTYADIGADCSAVIEVTDKLGVANYPLLADTDVYKITVDRTYKNHPYGVDETYGTIDLAPIVDGTDYMIWYRYGRSS